MQCQDRAQLVGVEGCHIGKRQKIDHDDIAVEPSQSSWFESLMENIDVRYYVFEYMTYDEMCEFCITSKKNYCDVVNYCSVMVENHEGDIPRFHWRKWSEIGWVYQPGWGSKLVTTDRNMLEKKTFCINPRAMYRYWELQRRAFHFSVIGGEDVEYVPGFNKSKFSVLGSARNEHSTAFGVGNRMIVPGNKYSLFPSL